MRLAMTEIKPGPELDFAVAKVAGFDVIGNEIEDDEVWVDNEDGRTSRMFRPSTDLNAAFAAAEKAGLFDDWLLTKGKEGWYFQDHSERYMEGIKAPTPALAICAAILHEKEER